MMKDAIFIDSNLLNNFWVDVINIANYLQNQLSTSHANNRKTAIIPKER